MACPVCGKRVQGENVLWTHMVFKHPDKANNHALGQGNEQVNEENTQPSVEIKKHPKKRQRGKKEENEKRNKPSPVGKEMVRTREQASKTIALDDKNPSKRKKTMKCQKEIVIEKNNVNNTKEKTPGRKKINIEVDEGILDLLMEQKTNDLLEEHITSLEKYVEQALDNLDNLQNKGSAASDNGNYKRLESPSDLPNKEAEHEESQQRATTPMERRILSPKCFEKTTKKLSVSQRKTFPSRNRTDIRSSSKRTNSLDEISTSGGSTMVTLIM